MPQPTQGQVVHELVKTVAGLDERLNNVRADITRLTETQTRTVESVNQMKTHLAVLDERLAELKRVFEEGLRRRWLIIGAFVGSLLTFLGNLILTLSRK